MYRLTCLALLLGASAGCSSGGPGHAASNGSTGAGGGSTSATGGNGAPSAGTGGGGCGGCAGLGKICGANNSCAPCTDDGQCAQANPQAPACQLAAADAGNYGTCVQCSANVSCAAGQVCDLRGIADPGPSAQSVGPNVCYPDCRAASGAGGGCTAGVAFCDSATGLCLYGCASTANNCSAGNQVCDLDGGRCVGCNGPGDCPDDLAGCLAGVCGNCAHDADCRSGQTCDVPNQLCVCHQSSQCGPLAPDCVVKGPNNPDSGQPELRCGCQPDAGSCGGGTHCQQGLGPVGGGECAPSCVDGGTNCAGGLSCNPVDGLCERCTSDVECDGNPQGFICLTDGGMAGTCACRVGAGGSCSRGTVCNPPLGCTPACTQSDAGCASGRVCDTATGACRGCLQNSDCAGNAQGLACSTGDGGSYSCLCHSAADCVDGGSCSSALHLCGLCAVPGDCPASAPGCSSASFTCGSCVASGDCPASAPHCSDAGACEQ